MQESKHRCIIPRSQQGRYNAVSQINPLGLMGNYLLRWELKGQVTILLTLVLYSWIQP